jgi:hypothetical protein
VKELMAEDGDAYVAPFLEASSWRAWTQQLACVSTMVGTELCRGNGPEWMMFVHQGGGLGNHGG